MPNGEDTKNELQAVDPNGRLRAINLTLAPDEEQLLSMTCLKNTREAFMLAWQSVQEAALNPPIIEIEIMGKKEKIQAPLSRLWRIKYLTLLRSVDKTALKYGVGLAHGQTEEEAVEPEEDNKW